MKSQPTLEDEELLEQGNSGTDTVTARLVDYEDDTRNKDLLLEITVKGVVGKSWQAFVACTRAKGLEYLKTVHIDHNDSSLYEQGHSWLDNCLDNHNQCGRLFWSLTNPTRLIKILNETQVQLVDASDLPKVHYVALSYCWGSKGSDEEWALTKKGMTWSDTLSRRLRPFDVAEFPDTLQHTITFVRRMEVEYVWVSVKFHSVNQTMRSIEY